LRQALREDGICLGEFLLVEEESVCFNPEFPVWIDLDAFQSVADQAIRTRNFSIYQEALCLACDELLVENRFDDWVIPHQEAYQQRVLKLLHGLAELHASQQDWPSAITVYNQLLAKEPVDETAHAGLMRAYAQSGQRDAAIRQYKRLERILQAELSTLPSPQTVQLLHAIQADQVSPPSILDRSIAVRQSASAGQPASTKKMEERQVRSRRNFLPSPLSSFIGREAVISDVLNLLREHCLVSLTGAGGVGKTRLALQIARKFLQAPAASEDQGSSHPFPDGIWYLAYTSLAAPDTLLQSLAQLFGILYHRKDRLLEMLEDYLHDKNALIVLDNCEGVAKPLGHVLDRLLSTSPALKVLVTSRVVLGVNGEMVYYVPPLSYAVPGQLPNPEIFQQFEAIQLFNERARTVMPGFQVTAQNAPIIAQICRALDGLPLPSKWLPPA
jgi:DNA-binding SARP family transcriptional activator